MSAVASRRDAGITTVRVALQRAAGRLGAAGIAPADREARWLCEHALGVSALSLQLDADRTMTAAECDVFDRLIKRRVAREPLQYILGTQEFCGLAIKVSPSVLIPRPDTEHLVRAAIAMCRGKAAPAIADIGTGSGCIAIALAAGLTDARVWATDRCREALAVADSNVRRHGVAGRITLVPGDLFDALPATQKFDAIVSNPPYIPEGDCAGLQPEVSEYEPRAALNGGADGLDFYGRLAAEAWRWLKDEGGVLLEVGAGQAASVIEIFLRTSRYASRGTVRDDAGIERVVSFVRA
jgi:release factor glutamine methyltransferase